MINIALIGAGQIGSRHLQGLKHINQSCNIQLMDINESALQIAQQRFDEVQSDGFIGTVSYLTTLSALEGDLDLAIIATSAKYRASIVHELLSKLKVKNIILEKVLFQSIEDYYTIETALTKFNINAFVNCPRRYFSDYQLIKKELLHSDNINMTVHGTNWRLASNGIHFIDLFQFITGESVKLNIDGLNPKIIDSKHEDLIEITGVLSGVSESKHCLSMTCVNGDNIPLLVEIYSNTKRFVIQESIKGAIKIQSESLNGYWEESAFAPIYQSQLTGTIVEDILQGNCKLAEYKDSMPIHIEFIAAVNNHLSMILNKKVSVCPIT